MQRIDAAELVAVAFHEPNKLADIRRDALADAAAPLPSDSEQRERGLELLRALQSGQVLIDS